MFNSELTRSFKVAAWLGWQIELNWTDPFLFAVYSIIKPLASAGILVIMYSIIARGNFGTPIFPYIYYGNAFYIYVGAVMAGISWAVIDDREHYKTLKYMYIAPIHIPVYWLGRGVARFLSGSIAVVITLGFGALFLQVPLDLARVNWPLFIASLAIGIAMLSMMGLILASITLLIAHHFFLIGEAVGERVIPFERGNISAGCPAGMAAAFWLRHADHLLARADAEVAIGQCGAGVPDAGSLHGSAAHRHPGWSQPRIRRAVDLHLPFLRLPGA